MRQTRRSSKDSGVPHGALKRVLRARCRGGLRVLAVAMLGGLSLGVAVAPDAYAQTPSVSELRLVPSDDALIARWSVENDAEGLSGFRLRYRVAGEPEAAWSNPVLLSPEARRFKIRGLSVQPYEVLVRAMYGAGLPGGREVAVATPLSAEQTPEPPEEGPPVEEGPPEEESPSTPDPSGEPMPVGDLPGWHQVFADDFTSPEPIGSFAGCSGEPLSLAHCSGLFGSPYFNRWSAYPDGWSGTPRTGTYFPSQTLSVQNGSLDYYIHTASVNGSTYHMIDAPEPKIPGALTPTGGLLYGRYVVRARWDALPGYHISFLLWPDSEVWPLDGEIDFPEANFDANGVSAFMHWQNATSSAQQDAYGASIDPSEWHTYEIDWLPSGVSFLLDGVRIGRSTSRIPDTPMHWVLQTGTSFDESTPSNSTAGHVQIDWAAVYRSA